MKAFKLHRVASAGVLTGVLLAASLGGAFEPEPFAPPANAPKVEPPGGEVLDMSKHMTGSVGQTGQFPGKIVCLRSKESFAPLSASECAAGERL